MQKTVLVITAGLLLSACSSLGTRFSKQDSVEYLGWYCEGDINSKTEWNCSERVLKNGQPVNERVIPSRQQAEDSTEAIVQVYPLEDSEVGVSDNEHLQLATASGSDGQAALNQPEVLVESALDDPVPTPESELFVQSADVAEEGEELALTNSESEANEKPETDHFDDFDINARGYTLQLGAYIRSSFARKTAREYDLDPAQMWIGDVITSDRPLVVLVYGQYPSIEAATVGGEQLQQQIPELQFWVRSMRSLRKAIAKVEPRD